MLLFMLLLLLVMSPAGAYELPNFGSWTLKSNDAVYVEGVYHYQVYTKRRQTISLITTWDLTPIAVMKRDHRGTENYLYVLGAWLLVDEIRTFVPNRDEGTLTITYTVDGLQKITVW